MDSLYWLLQEPVLHGTRLVGPAWGGASLSGRLAAGVLTLGQVVELTGPKLEDGRRLAERLHITSVRITERLLQHWKHCLSGHQVTLLELYHAGRLTPDPTDPFPNILLLPDLN